MQLPEDFLHIFPTFSPHFLHRLLPWTSGQSHVNWRHTLALPLPLSNKEHTQLTLFHIPCGTSCDTRITGAIALWPSTFGKCWTKLKLFWFDFSSVKLFKFWYTVGHYTFPSGGYSTLYFLGLVSQGIHCLQLTFEISTSQALGWEINPSWSFYCWQLLHSHIRVPPH